MKKILFLLVLIAAGCQACNKVTIKAPNNFNVTTSKTAYKTGDSVVFKFTGNPDNINFYTGEAGRKYDSAITGSINIKSLSQPPPLSYVWKYATPGSYKAVFVAQNSDVDHVKQVVREVKVTITP
ncbi:MAG TPA: DUF5017 domain-containing protein [Puia sp.]|nr:DUF5017 domain-containing protein [Puia sp.]